MVGWRGGVVVRFGGLGRGVDEDGDADGEYWTISEGEILMGLMDLDFIGLNIYWVYGRSVDGRYPNRLCI